ncbi:MAG: hypothetical protein HQ515_08550 [Phycisphaeraceae bacterium]|jgi:hypothetical protein|nr:hypothetical protein [Phycisphaeraceae bacterium]
MRLILRIVSLLSLLGLILPSFLFLTGHVTDLNQVKWYMLIATIVWFATATPVMWKEKKA